MWIFLFALLVILAGCTREQVGGPLPIIYEGTETILDVLPAAEMPVEVTPENAPKMIRVLINISGFAGRVHTAVSFTATGAFSVLGVEERWEFGAGEIFALHDAADMRGEERLWITGNDPDTRLQIVGLGRNWPDGSSPLYRGALEISPTPGGFIVVNELLLEEYLYAVVPSEMPSAFGLEASMVQAIAARTFAVRQFYENRFRAYGAHIDDSVISQVYNNLPETEIAIAAVRATRGLVLTYGGQVVVANYFSTSGGTTANAGEVWSAEGVFPGITPPHLRAQAQFDADFEVGDLRLEEYASAFFRNGNVPGIDRDAPWFRWQVLMTGEALNRAVTGIGPLEEMVVTRRGQGGNIMEMLFVGTYATRVVQTEFAIRTLLAPRNSRITRHDGSVLNGWSMMPSAFFTMEKERDAAGRITAVTFFGGGHGHGVGMSQMGARALLDAGFTYREVLLHFYPGVEITNLFYSLK